MPPDRAVPVVVEVRQPVAGLDQRWSGAARGVGQPYAVGGGTEVDALGRERGGAGWGVGRAGEFTGGARVTEGEVAHGASLDARPDTELVLEYTGQHVELAQHAGSIAVTQHRPHDADVFVLVGRIHGDEAFEVADGT